MATDWTKLRIEYVTSSVTLRDLATKHGVNAAGVMRRAAKEGWEAERKQESAKVSKAVLESSATDRAAELEKFNADDLKMARALRAKAASMMSTTSTPQDLSALARAVDTAQKIGRLALGATTDNAGISGPDGGPVRTSAMTEEKYEEINRRLADEV